MPNEWITIGGVRCKERPGSPQWEYGDSPTIATRMLSCQWSDIDKLITALSKTPTTNITDPKSPVFFTKWLGQIGKAPYYSSMIVKPPAIVPTCRSGPYVARKAQYMITLKDETKLAVYRFDTYNKYVITSSGRVKRRYYNFYLETGKKKRIATTLVEKIDVIKDG
jgi:hypothetical protein